jgi:hypothetical protein
MPVFVTRFQLFDVLTAGSGKLHVLGERMGYVQSVEREDGSGRSFNVRMRVRQWLGTGPNSPYRWVEETFHVRITD